MRTPYSVLAIAAMLAATALGQSDQKVEKVFQFVHTATPQGFQEVTNAIRAITEVQQVAVVTESKAVALRGTANQVSMAEWLFRLLDQPAGAPPNSAKLEYAVSGASNDLARVFFVTNTLTPQSLQEIVNPVRSVGDIQRMMVYNGQGALVIRGTAEQISLAEWLIRALDKPAGGGPFEYLLRDGSGSVVRVFYPSFIATAQHLQESVNMIRSITEMQRVVPYSRDRAIVLRGSAEQAAMAERLLNALAKPAIAAR